MVIEDFGLFRYLTTNIPNIYLDDGPILFYSERKNYGKKNTWHLFDPDRCSNYIIILIKYKLIRE